MKTKSKLRTPLIITGEPSQSVGGIANDYHSVDDLSQNKQYHSLGTFDDRNSKTDLYQNDESIIIEKHSQSSIGLTIFITILLLMMSITTITLSILSHKHQYNDILYLSRSNMVLSASIAGCITFCAVYKLINIWCRCNSLHIMYIFSITSCIISLILFILSLLNKYISYPFWLNILLISYTCFIIITLIIIHVLPPNYFAHIDTSLPNDFIHKEAPSYITKYGALHPYDRSLVKNIWHSFTHQWVWNIIKLGYNQPLQIYDCYAVPKHDHILSQYAVWDHYLQTAAFIHDKFSTFKCVWQIEGRSFTARCVIYMTALLSSLAVPFIISALSDFYEDKSIAITVGIYLSLGLWIVALVRIEIVSLIFTMTARSFARCRAFLIYAIYRKAILLSLSSSTNDGKSSIGQKITMMGSDTRLIASAFAFLHFLFANLVLVIIICVLLYYEVGYAAFIGWIFFILFTGPIQAWIGKKVHKASKKYITNSDVRVKFIGELIRGILVTKMYCWQSALLDKVFEYRQNEMKQLLIRNVYSAILSMMNICTPHLMILLMLGFYVLMGNDLTLSTTFAVISLVQLLRISIRAIPWGIQIIVGAMVSFKRLNQFFSNKEQKDIARIMLLSNEKNMKYYNEMPMNAVVFMKHAAFQWTDAMESDVKKEFKLQDISLSLEKGKLYALVGLVGSGKTSMIQAILGEMIMKDGYCQVNHDKHDRIGYVSQKQFIINETVRENILFGVKYDEDNYAQCISAAALTDDLLILANGDLTEIGERGINLSGGQKARISFARALYRKLMVDLYLLDDPLSAVDVHVGKIMFNEGVLELLKGKTRVIVMNSHLDLLQYMDEIIIMDEGQIAYQGAYQHIKNNEKYLHLLPKPRDIDTDKEEEEEKAASDTDVATKRKSNGFNDSKMSLKAMNERNKRGKLTTKEDRGIGSIKWNVYSRYFSNSAHMFDHTQVETSQIRLHQDTKSKTSVSGVLLIVLEVALLILAQTFSSLSDIWLSFWAEEDERQRFSEKEEMFWIMIWSIIIAVLTITAFCASYLFGYLSIRAAQSLHMKTLYSVLRAPMSYFNATPTGRILNRFSKDTNEMDDELIQNFNKFSQDLLMVLGYFVVIVISNYYTFIILLILLPIIYWLQSRYRPSSRDLKRITQISFTPIITQFNETLVGLDTIRAYKLNGYFLDKMVSKTNDFHKVLLTEQMALRWFSVGMDLLIAVFIFIVAFSATLLREHFAAALLSLSVVYGYGLMGMLQWAIRSSVEVEKNFTSIERLLYFEDIEPESDPINFDYRSPKQWPSEGRIVIKNLKMKYRADLDYVLKGINVTINRSEKIGIVGRTGAGKSSLFKALFRTFEPEIGSFIEIDGVNALKLGVSDLRNHLSIIPQDAVLFSGSIRFNLDPFNEYSDEQLWDILRKCELFDLVHNKEEKLMFDVKENGSNFSMGQKQLICIARALLKKSKILLLDEATSSIDKHTDKLIQKLIREQFKDRTVLCIAHRLETIVDYDRIMVLNNGEVLEFDTPQNLLHNNSQSLFKNMIQSENKSK